MVSINKILLFLVFVSAPIISSSGENKPAEPVEQKTGMTKTEKVEAQIERIEKKLQAEPKVEGWTLLGNANMYLKKYDAAARAYQKAYILSDYSPETRKKLKNALYYVQSGVEEVD